jgi:hypothetical protein
MRQFNQLSRNLAKTVEHKASKLKLEDPPEYPINEQESMPNSEELFAFQLEEFKCKTKRPVLKIRTFCDQEESDLVEKALSMAKQKYDFREQALRTQWEGIRFSLDGKGC